MLTVHKSIYAKAYELFLSIVRNAKIKPLDKQPLWPF